MNCRASGSPSCPYQIMIHTEFQLVTTFHITNFQLYRISRLWYSILDPYKFRISTQFRDFTSTYHTTEDYDVAAQGSSHFIISHRDGLARRLDGRLRRRSEFQGSSHFIIFHREGLARR